MPTLLLEIGTEELPASACREATAQLPEASPRRCSGASADELFVGPRRLAFLIRDFDPTPPKQWLQGPPLAIGLDRAGSRRRRRRASRAATASRPPQLEQRDGFLGLEVEGAPIEERLAELVRGLVLRQVDGLARRRPALLAAGALARRAPRPGAAHARRGRHPVRDALAGAPLPRRRARA